MVEQILQQFVQQPVQSVLYLLSVLFIAILAATGGSDDEEEDDSDKRDRKLNRGDDDN
jgi:hypothetical protein